MTQGLPQVEKTVWLERRPAPRLRHRGLTLLLGLVVLCPVTLGTLIYLMLPTAHDRPLAVAVDLLSEQGKPHSLRLKNKGDVPLQNVRIELNGAFAYFPQASLAVNEQVDLSLGWFMKKTGQHFPPAQTAVRTVHVSARLPGNQRALFAKEFSPAP